ncbi:MAG: DNA repair protein RecO [Phycisphaerales bacterium]
MPPVHDAALCIRHWDWSETSQTVSLFTRGHGLVRALAKGAKRPGSPFSGGLELLTVGDAGLVIKPTTELALLTEWDLTEIFPALRTSLPRQHAGLYAADLLQRLVTDRDPHPDLFDAAVTLFRALDIHDDPAALLRFQFAALTSTGYRPVLDRDVRTGAELPSSKPLAFSPSLGGLTSDTAASDASPLAEELWRVRPATIGALRAIDAASPEEVQPISRADTDRANRLLAAYIRHLIGIEPPTLGLVFPDLAGKPAVSRSPA